MFVNDPPGASNEYRDTVASQGFVGPSCRASMLAHTKLQQISSGVDSIRKLSHFEVKSISKRPDVASDVISGVEDTSVNVSPVAEFHGSSSQQTRDGISINMF